MSDTANVMKSDWQIELAETGVRWPCIFVHDDNYDGGVREICQISQYVAKRGKDRRWRRTPEADETMAIANLIKASPVMLAVLRDIFDATNADGENSYRADDREGCLDFVHSIARDAIAKAEGRK